MLRNLLMVFLVIVFFVATSKNIVLPTIKVESGKVKVDEKKVINLPKIDDDDCFCDTSAVKKDEKNLKPLREGIFVEKQKKVGFEITNHHKPKSTENWDIKHLSFQELKDSMRKDGYKNLDKYKTIQKLRFLRIAYEYDMLYWDVNDITGLPVSVIYAFHRIEAVYPTGLESTLARNNWNFGGIKYSKKLASKYSLNMDDCTDSKGRRVKCKFSDFGSYEKGMVAWAKVFNKGRYKRCKSSKKKIDIFLCIYNGGYHTENNVRARNSLSQGYFEYVKDFPDKKQPL